MQTIMEKKEYKTPFIKENGAYRNILSKHTVI